MVLIDMCGIVTANLCLGLADVPCSLRRPGDAEALCTLEVTFPERTRVVSFGVIASARNCQLNSAERGGYIDTVRGTAIEGETDLYWLAYRAPQPLDVQSLSFQVRALDGSCFYRGGAERACRVLPGCCCVLCWQLKPSAGETLRLRCVAICNEDIPAEQQQQQTSAAATRGRIPVRTLSLHSCSLASVCVSCPLTERGVRGGVGPAGYRSNSTAVTALSAGHRQRRARGPPRQGTTH